MSTSAQERERLWEMIKDIRVAMLTSVGEDGRLRSRPMYTQQEEQPDGLWFLTARPSEKVSEIAQSQQVNLSYVDPDKNLFVSIAGRGRLVDDREKARELWNPMNEVFPEGPEDPSLVVVHVEAESAEYWDGPSGKMRQLFSMARAAVTGKHSDMGENETVDFD